MEEISEQFQNGKIILIDKALTWTSFDAVKKVRGTVKVKKVGHAGTLDPLATGLLIICTGKFTKKLNEFQGLDKTYSGTIKLGATTPSYDRETEETFCSDCSNITFEDVVQAAEQLTGLIEQVPPIYSAVKVDGVRAYKKARQGVETTLKTRQVQIHAFEVEEGDWPLVKFRVSCSKGTYIRSLANDLGEVLGCGAYLYSLRRESIGDFSVKDAVTIDQFVEDIQRLKAQIKED